MSTMRMCVWQEGEGEVRVVGGGRRREEGGGGRYKTSPQSY